MLRAILTGLLVGILALPPLHAGAQRKGENAPVPLPGPADCKPLPSAGKIPWQPGEKLNFDIDVLGAQAGKLALVVLDPVGKGESQEHSFRALAASNSLFSKVRRVRGRSTSYVRGRDMLPRRYQEATNEGGVVKSADVLIQRKTAGSKIVVDWKRGKAKGKRSYPYLHQAFDPVSTIYYLRTLDFSEGMPVCFDAYGIRKLWRVSGKVKGLETVKVPAGVFKAWHIEGRAIRTDDPRRHREVHVWISADEKRLPLASLGVLDLGPVRAQLTHVSSGGAGDSEEGLMPDAPPAPAKR